MAMRLVEERLAACVSVLPGVVSTYRWEGELRQDREVLLIAKTTEDKYQALERRIIELHPHDLPEVLAFTVWS